MSSEFVIALVAGIGGMLGWGLADFFAKKTIDRIGDVASLAWAGVFGSAFFLLASWYRSFVYGVPILIPSDFTTFALLFFFGALQAAVYLFAYKGFGKGQLALLNPIFAAFSGIVAIISIVFLGEPTTPARILALAIIFGGVLLMNLDLDALRSRKISFLNIPGFWEILVAMLLAAVWTVLWDGFVSGKDWLSYALMMFILMTITVFIAAAFQKTRLHIDAQSTWFFVALIGISETIAYCAISWGYGATSLTSIVSVLSGAFSLPTIVLAYYFLHERVTRAQTIGSLIIVGGIALLSLV